MSGESDLSILIKTLKPSLSSEEFVFCCVQGELAEFLHLQPIASFIEEEGLSLIIPAGIAIMHGFVIESVFKKISLSVHSNLDAVGLTAVIAAALANEGISANVVAAYYHDHIFVPSDKAELAIQALLEMSEG